MTDAIVGYTGFVGGHLWEHLPDADVYNSKNIQLIQNKEYNSIYFTGLSATKWLINKEPLSDIMNILAIQKYLKTLKCNKFILISTIDIYNDMQPYGKHRIDFENWALEQCNLGNVCIVRLPAIYGPGLKKNIIFDYLNNKKINYNAESTFQWYDVSNLWNDIHQNANTKILELYTEPLKLKEIIPEEYVQQSLAPIITYNYSPKNGYIDTKLNTLQQISKFIQFCQVDKSKLTVSNLMWSESNDEYMFSILKRYGISNIELVPTKYFDGNWDIIFDNTEYIKNKYKDFRIVSLQCIFHNIDGNLKDDYATMLYHLMRLMCYASDLGAERIVFGSPKIRHNNETFISFLKSVSKYADIVWPNGIICIEPNSKLYGCAVGTNFKETLALVQKINASNVQINYDTGNAMMENDTDYDLLYIKHIQVSMPHLGELDGSKINNALIKSKKDCFISLEVKPDIDIKNAKINIKRFIELFI